MKGGKHGALACLCCCVCDYWRDRRYCVVHSEKVSFGVGVGEGLAAMRGHQSGAEGAAVAMPTFSREIETVSSVNIPLPGTNFFQ